MQVHQIDCNLQRLYILKPLCSFKTAFGPDRSTATTPSLFSMACSAGKAWLRVQVNGRRDHFQGKGLEELGAYREKRLSKALE